MLEQYWIATAAKDASRPAREKAWAKFQEIGLPDRHREAFQYVQKKDLSFPKPATKRHVQGKKQEQSIVFIDGFFREELSSIESPIVCQSLDNALKTYGIFIQNRLQKTIKEETDPFAALNGAFHGEGVFLYVPPKCKAALHLVQIFEEQAMVSPRLHLYLGRDAQVTLTQRTEGNALFSNTYMDIALDEGATLRFRDFHAGHFQSIRATLKKNSYLQTVFLGSVLRTSANIQLSEEHSTAHLLGLAKTEAQQEIHFHTLMEHQAPHTSSRQHIKSVLKDKSCFSFEGKIYVHPIAQKTESYQLNNNLLLSDSATANAKPNLEIFADDVKASHGATFGKLNEDHIFYLRSRGLSLEQAKEHLIEGFCNEIVDYAK